MIDNLSAYQLRSHYLIYSTISELFSNNENTFRKHENRAKMRLFMPAEGYFIAMDFTQQESDNLQILDHIFNGLAADGLIEGRWSFGHQEFLNTIVSGVPSEGFICTPSALGAELLLWAFGHGDKNLDFLLTDDFSPEIKSEIEEIPKSVPNAVPTADITSTSS